MTDTIESDGFLEEELAEISVDLLPAWFSSRMSTDEWLFGLHLSDGSLLAITSITKFTQASDATIWVDAEMADASVEIASDHWRRKLITSPTSRTRVSVNAAHIIAAFELADT